MPAKTVVKKAPKKRTRTVVAKPVGPTPEQEQAIIMALKVGATYERAAQAAGVKKADALEWLRRGRGETDKKPTKKLLEWAEAVEEAMAFAEIRSLKVIHNAAAKTWTAAAWYLERTNPDRYAQKSRHELTGKDGKSLGEDLGTFLAKGFKK
jgi:hypothetical protein